MFASVHEFNVVSFNVISFGVITWTFIVYKFDANAPQSKIGKIAWIAIILDCDCCDQAIVRIGTRTTI